MLDHIPFILIVLGLCAYSVLAGADFGAGFWILVSSHDSKLADQARHSMGPVWEANHVWLIFILVVSWTTYPRALASVTSTLAIALLIALVGIVLRGTAYAVRAQTGGPVGRRIERVLGISSILAPFAFGAVAGGIASGRVPVGNARGDLITSWLNPTSIVLGILSVTTGWYLAAVYLATDSERNGEPQLAREFRARALASGTLAGGVALIALLVIHSDAPLIWHGVTNGWGIPALALSIAAGLGTLALVQRGQYRWARWTAATAVAAVVAGWGIAQRNDILPGLTVHAAAAGHSTIVAVLIAIGGGVVVLLPSLVLLFRLSLTGRFDGDAEVAAAPRSPVTQAEHGRLRAGLAVVLLLAGAALTVFSASSWGTGIGVAGLFGCIIVGFPILANVEPVVSVSQYEDR